MTASRRDAGSSVLVEVPVPLNVTEMKTQPSVARVNVNSALGSEIDEAWSSSATRLFRFFSAGAVNGRSAPPPVVHSRNEKRPEAIAVTLIGSRPSTGASEAYGRGAGRRNPPAVVSAAGAGK